MGRLNAKNYKSVILIVNYILVLILIGSITYLVSRNATTAIVAPILTAFLQPVANLVFPEETRLAIQKQVQSTSQHWQITIFLFVFIFTYSYFIMHYNSKDFQFAGGVTLIYGTSGSFFILINEGVDLTDLSIHSTIPRFEGEIIADRLSFANGVQQDICLHYYINGHERFSSEDCNERRIIPRMISVNEVFWYDNNNHNYADVWLVQHGQKIGDICTQISETCEY